MKLRLPEYNDKDQRDPNATDTRLRSIAETLTYRKSHGTPKPPGVLPLYAG
jgi:hypothetical protein